MNRGILYLVLLLVAALSAACSSSEDMTGNEMAGEHSNVPLSILGTSGNSVMNTGASYGEYAAFVNVPGKWSIATSKGLTNI